MRITGGTHRGRVLESPKDDSIRPTADKVRLAVFNMLEARGLVHGAHVLDAFSGTGAMGLEALSRGAESCTFMDIDGAALALTRCNGERLGVDAAYLLKNACQPGQRPESVQPATLLFLDPPYGRGLIPQAVHGLKTGGWAQDGAAFVIEAAKGEIVPAEGLSILQDKTYGQTRILIAV